MKKYTLAVTSPEYWSEIHDALIVDSNQDGIPDRQVTCTDDKNHSPTRGTYELTEEEAAEIATHPHVKWIELSPNDNPEVYPKPQPVTKRFKSNVRVYRDLGASNDPPNTSPTSAELNRTNWAVVRVGLQTNGDGWPNVSGSIAPITTDVSYSLTGKNVDLIIQDSGILQYHPEYMKGDGTSRVRDVILDGPLYIDPDSSYLQANTYIKADGRTGISTTAANLWWENNSTSYRSAQFASGGANDFGTISIASAYTVPNALGDSLDGTNTINASHGNGCAALAGGKTLGVAFEADIWNISIFGAADMNTELTYDAIKVFHKYKKVNPETGRQNPTVVNGSWGYFAGFDSGTTVDYSFKGTTGSFTGYASNSTGAQAMAYGLDSGNVYDRQYSTSSRSSSTDTAGDEMVESGVIFVVAAGNDNQRIGRGTSDPHLNDYLTTLNSSETRSGFPQGTGTCPSGHRKWIHPSSVGYISDGTEQEYYHTINVGCLDEHIGGLSGSATYAERKVSYSNNGPGIDVFGPGDETLSAGTNGVSGATDYQRYDDSRFYDMFFNGTSAASPIVAGVVALYMQSNPSATSYDVHEWIKTHGSKVLDTSQFIDQYPDDTTDDYWRQDFNLRGAEPRIIHDPFANDTAPKLNGVTVSGISFKQS